jgi:branched-subunit amino acid ABC-type transport system permease component
MSLWQDFVMELDLLLLRWLLVMTFVAVFRVLGVFHLAHSTFVVWPAMIAIGLSNALTPTGALVAGLAGAAACNSALNSVCISRLDEHRRRGTPGLLLSLALFLLTQSVTLLFAPPDTQVLPEPLRVGSPFLHPGRHKWITLASLSCVAIMNLWSFATAQGRQYRLIQIRPGAAALLGVDVARCRSRLLVATTVAGGVIVILLAGSGSGVRPETAFPYALLALIVTIVIPPQYTLGAQCMALAFLCTRWLVTALTDFPTVFADQLLILCGVLAAALWRVLGRYLPGHRIAQDPEDTTLALRR